MGAHGPVAAGASELGLDLPDACGASSSRADRLLEHEGVARGQLVKRGDDAGLDAHHLLVLVVAKVRHGLALRRRGQSQEERGRRL